MLYRALTHTHYCCEPQLNAEATAGELQHAIAALPKTHERRVQAHAVPLRQIDTLQEEEEGRDMGGDCKLTNTPRPQWGDLLDGIPVVASKTMTRRCTHEERLRRSNSESSHMLVPPTQVRAGCGADPRRAFMALVCR